MSAEILRRAAALMRERAERATPGTWSVFDMDDELKRSGDPLNEPGQGWYWVWSDEKNPGYYAGVLEADKHHPDCGSSVGVARINDCEGGIQEQADAEHIASWHPAIALAVADWLFDIANRREDRNQLAAVRSADFEKAVAVARAYLGESS